LKTLYDAKWAKLLQADNGYVFLERKGKDSIAVLPFRFARDLISPYTKSLQILIRYQFLPVSSVPTYNDLFPCPITGTIDDLEPAIYAAKRELREETGFSVDVEDLIKCGGYVVGTQTNEICHHYLVNVTDLPQGDPELDGSEGEEAAHNEWKSYGEVNAIVRSSNCISSLKILFDEINMRIL